MKDIPVVGGRNLGGNVRVYSLDSISNHAAGNDVNRWMKALTRPVAPLGYGGDMVFRRLYITVQHETGIAFFVTPVVDDVEVKALRTYLSRPSGKERYTFTVPLGLRFKNNMTGLRGSSIQFRIEAQTPSGTWKIEKIEVAYQPGLLSKREDD